MKRKGGRRKPSPAAATDIVDLKDLIHGHGLFFDRLVEMIPARFYLPADEDKPWFQGLSKDAKAESRVNLRESRRARLDPAKSSTTTLDLLKKSIEAEKIATDTSEEEDNGDEDDGENEMEVDNPHPVICDDRFVTYQELRQWLHRRIEELRSGRNTWPIFDKHRPNKKEKKKKNNKKKNVERDASASHGKRKRDEKETREEEIKKKMAKTEAMLSLLISPLGRSRLAGLDENMRKRRKLSKQQELERAKMLEEAKKDPERGLNVSKKHSWKAAVSRAAGMKVHDDPKLLKESIKKEKKIQQKHVEKWKERVKNTEKIRVEKQKTRAENIKGRINQKKMRRIEKREKKLMRPGFEGRKEGYVNE